jgi:type II secretory pathway pseudopilin PulG
MPHNRRHNNFFKCQGAALMLMLTILVIGTAALLVSSLSHSAAQIELDQKTAVALALAKEALIGDAVSQTPITSAGYLRLPDQGFVIGLTPYEGSSAPNFSGNSKDYSVIGKLPWRTLGLKPLRDGMGECPWYIVSGRFKNTPTTDAFNWDTLGQINLVDGNGNIIGSNLAALVVAPGQALDGQNRTLSDPTYAQCGGNYDVRNYLDPYTLSNATPGTVNYFTGSTNNRVALDTSNKLLVMTENGHYNDRFLFITSDEIFRVLTRRADFSAQVSALLNDAYFQSVVIAGAKGTNNVKATLNKPLIFEIQITKYRDRAKRRVQPVLFCSFGLLLGLFARHSPTMGAPVPSIDFETSKYSPMPAL